MRCVFIYFSVTTALCCCSIPHKQTINNPANEVKQLLLGKWILTTDDKFTIDIEKDKITYYYYGTVVEANIVEFVCSDSLMYFRTNDDAFDFMKNGELHTMVKIVEYTNQRKDTIVNTIVYVDKEGMELTGRNRSVSFRKSK